MSEQKSKNDVAWEALFAEHDILADIDATGAYRITATAINKQREARLMTKFDHLANRPQIFKDNDLSILPTSRGAYIVGRFDCYATIPQQHSDDTIGRVYPEFPDGSLSLSPDDLYSESAMLLCAYYSGLISDVLNEEVRLTFFGRMSAGEFDFSILAKGAAGGQPIKHNLSVEKAQSEVDGGFEGAGRLAIVEAKQGPVEDFHIRQLYFPYRTWAEKIKHKKPVTPVFLNYSNEIFSFHVYEFEEPGNYNSLRLVTRKRYQIVPTEIEISDVRRILAGHQVKPEPEGVPFPQADTFTRVVDLLSLLKAAGGTLTQDEITTSYDFDVRQTQYYYNAGAYLRLIERAVDQERGGVIYSLTALGVQIMSKAPQKRNLALVELILAQRVFRATAVYYLTNAQAPPIATIVMYMTDAKLTINNTTKARRAQTVIVWVKWIIGLTAEE